MTDQPADVTLADGLLLAAGELSRAGMDSYTPAELTVAAWRTYPKLFSLAGYASHADSHKVYYTLSHSRGPVRLGLLARIGPNVFRLTEAGKVRLSQLRDGGPPLPSLTIRRNLGLVLVRLLGSRAWELEREDRRKEVTVYEAFAWWGLTVGHVNNGEAAAALGRHAEALRGALEACDGCEVTLPGGRQLDLSEARGLANLDDWLREKFARHLAVLTAARGDGGR